MDVLNFIVCFLAHGFVTKEHKLFSWKANDSQATMGLCYDLEVLRYTLSQCIMRPMRPIITVSC